MIFSTRLMQAGFARMITVLILLLFGVTPGSYTRLDWQIRLISKPHFLQIRNSIADLQGEKFKPAEIKSGKTMSTPYFDNLKYWYTLVGTSSEQGAVVYGGDQTMQTSSGALLSWRQLYKIL